MHLTFDALETEAMETGILDASDQIQLWLGLRPNGDRQNSGPCLYQF